MEILLLQNTFAVWGYFRGLEACELLGFLCLGLCRRRFNFVARSSLAESSADGRSADFFLRGEHLKPRG
jgi:hypothetical protein